MKFKALLFLFLSISTFGQNFNFTSTWDSIRVNLSKKNYQNANLFINQAKTNAIKENKRSEYLFAVFQEIESLRHTHTNQFIFVEKAAIILENEIKTGSKLEQAIVNHYYANLLFDRIHIKPIKEDNTSTNFLNWSKVKKLDFVDSLLVQSIKDYHILQQEPAKNWKLLFTSNHFDNEKNKDIKTSYANYNSFSIAPTLFHLIGNLYLNGINNIYGNFINDKESRNQILKQKITFIQNEIERLNTEKKYNEAKAYQYYLNLGYNRNEQDFEQLISELKKNPADFNTQILFNTINSQDYTYYYNRKYIQDAIPKIDQAIELYPNTIWTNNLIQLKKKITRPSFSIEIPDSYSTKEFIPINITSAKVPQLYLKIYKNNHPFDKKVFDFKYDTITKSYQTNAILQYEENIKLKAFTDYLNHETLYKINPLETGEYFIVASNNPSFTNDDETNIVQYTSFKISDYFVKLFEIDEAKNGNNYKTQIINRKTGFPLANTKIEIYNDGEKKDYDKVKTVKTNKVGEFFYTSNDDSDLKEDLEYLYLYIPSTKEFIDLSDYDLDEFNDNDNESKIEKSATILTDRAIYRPSQEVFFKAIAFEKDNKKGKVLPNLELKAILHDANQQKIDSLTLTTNEFGSINGKFKLPEETLNGYFRISILDNKIYLTDQSFQVEEYKRPTYKVVLEQPAVNYNYGDEAIFKGFVESLSGARLNNVKVNYKISKSFESENTTNETVTDENGEFIIKLKLEGKSSFDYITIFTDAINTTGESQSTSLTYYYGKNPYKINISIPSIALNKDWKDVIINTENYNKKFAPLKGNVTIYQLPEADNIYGKHEYNFDSDYAILSTEKKKKYFGKYNLDDKNLDNKKRYWKNYKVIQTSSFDTNEKKFITINQPEKLQKGKYLVDAISIVNNDTISDFKIIKIAEDESFRFSNKEFLTVGFSQPTYKVGETFSVNFETDFKDEAVILLYLQEENKFKTTLVIPFKNGKATYSTKVTQALIDTNFQIDYLMIHHNQYQSGSVKIPIQFSTHQLDIKTEVFRDKIQPGQQETWSIKVTNTNNEQANAEVLATMYDASLDQFASNNFSRKINWYSWPNYHLRINEFMNDFYDTSSLTNQHKTKVYNPLVFEFPQLKTRTFQPFYLFNTNYDIIKKSFSVGANTTFNQRSEYTVDYILNGEVSGVDLDEIVTVGYATNSVTVRGAASITGKNPLIVVNGVIQEDTFDVSKLNITSTTVLKDQSATALYGSRGANGVIIITTDGKSEKEETIDLSKVKTRTNLNETAFFFPTLRTDQNGNVAIEFTSPEALTEWKLLVFAHDKDLNSGNGTFTTKTQKDLMVSPHLPRFLRTNDEVILSAQIQNISSQNLNGLARIELINPHTNEVINNLFDVVNNEKSFEVNAKQASLVEWRIKVPTNLDEVIVKIVAGTSTFSDGEQQALPILSNKILVTEAETIVVLPNEEKEIKINIDQKNFKNLKIEVESNPLFSVLSILNRLATYPYDCTEQTTSKWYAYKMLEQIKTQYPSITTYFEEILKDKNVSTAFENEIKKTNTSWINQAKTQKENLIELAKTLDGKNVSKELKALENKIISSQLKDGSFPWFEGGKTNHEITKQNLTYIGRVIKNYPDLVSNRLKESFEKGVDFMIQYNLNLNKSDKKTTPILTNYIDLMYIYQFHPITNIKLDEVKKIYQTQFNKIENYVGERDLTTRAKAAIITQFLGNKTHAKNIITSLETEMISEQENGSYWNDATHYFLETPLSTQAILVEAFKANNKETTSLIQWMMLKHKQNAWQNTLSNNYTVSSILSTLKSKEISEQKVSIQGLEKMETTKVFGQEIFETKDRNQVSDSFTIKNNQTFNTYGSIEKTYEIPFEEIKAHQNKLRVEREILINENNAWIPLNREIKLGEKLKIRLTLIANEEISYVHLKDNRSAGFEPVYKPSGYSWNRILPYYSETKDTETNFFIDRLPKGNHTFEYEVKANHLGDFSTGISQVESMYNSSYKAHTKSNQIKIIN